jgi:hypothetical protein
MSSAILYLAIIAIWACVLIPRWLRRDSPRSAAAQDVIPDDPLASDPPADSTAADSTAADSTAADSAPADSAPADSAEVDSPVAGGDASAPLSREESRKRVLTARRRLLWTMLSLEAAGGALAGTGLAAWWVIAPPTVMLAGYLFLLRAAARADAERDAQELAAKEATRARAASARERAGRDSAAGSDTATAMAPAPAAFAAAPVPEDYDDLAPGRDFTPGRRRTSAADRYEDHDAYDQYTENRLRAVGD